MMTYSLINDNGCLMAEVEAKSFGAARAYFAARYSGSYVILCAEIDARRRVRLA